MRSLIHASRIAINNPQDYEARSNIMWTATMKKFARFTCEVWGISADGKTDEQLAEAGLSAMENWMRELGLVMNISELGATDEMIESIADGTIILNGGYKVLNRDEVVQILTASM